jgi:hypothetical protein
MNTLHDKGLSSLIAATLKTMARTAAALQLQRPTASAKWRGCNTQDNDVLQTLRLTFMFCASFSGSFCLIQNVNLKSYLESS